MTSVSPISEFFTAGGTLSPDAPSYVQRPTDDELYQNIKAGEFCYVLTPRQMGKSSLMIRTARRLMDEGIRSAIVDLTQTGTVESEDQWYKGILSQIQRRLRLQLDPVMWWGQRQDIPNIQKFIEFFEEALTEIKEHIVIFMDEIDTTLKLEFRDNFFAGIRAIYNARAENPDLRRLTFVLLGVASPSDLIKDRSRTPFNIGQEIPLKSFSRGDASMLEQGLEAAYPGEAARILNRVFDWTNGHPYLTQKICQSLADEPVRKYDDSQVDNLVEKLFISEQASGETNLQFVRESVLYYPERKENLFLYKKVLEGKEVRDNKNSITQNHLKLAGLVRVDDGRLVVSNNIYAKVFDLPWVNRYTEVNWSRRISIALGIIVVFLLSVIAYDAVYLPNIARKAIDDATIYNDDRGIRALAVLFQLNPILLPNEYEYKAKDIFFNRIRADQVALIEIDHDNYNEMIIAELPEFKQDYRMVVLGLYTSLADVDRTGQTSELLKEMNASLATLHMQDDPLYLEIDAWQQARLAASGGELSRAIVYYNLAIEKNASNPATQFERARLYAQEKSSYAKALDDYESVLGIVPESNIEPTAGPSPTGVSELGETAVPISPPAGGTLELSPLPQSTPATAIAATASLAAPSSSIPTLPFQSRFLTMGQRIAAVRNDIFQNADLYAFYVHDRTGSYPNLLKSVPQQTETPAPQAGNFRPTQTITTLGDLTRGSTITHTVVEGDWLEQIARCYGASIDAVFAANPQIADLTELVTATRVVVPNIGSVGQIYGPPCVIFYDVAAGDTWQSIAIQHNAAVDVLMEANRDVRLVVGARVKVPLNSAQYGGSVPVPIASSTNPSSTALAATANAVSPAGSGNPISIYVDVNYTGSEAGTMERPYNTMAEGIVVAQTNPGGGYIYIKQDDGTWVVYGYIAAVVPPATGGDGGK